MQKILHLLSSNIFSGAENVVCTIIKNSRDEYEAAYCSPDGKIREKLEKEQIEYYPLKRMNLSEIKGVIKRYNPNIIHAHDYTASVLVAMSGFRGRMISHLHTNSPFARKWNLKTIVYSKMITKYSHIVGVSDKIYEEAIFKNKMRDKYSTIYNYVDKEEIIRKSLEYDFDQWYDLFFIGRLTEPKNPLMFIEIVKNIVRKDNNIKAVIIGDGELKQQCIDLIEEYQLKQNIELLGFVENPFPIIKKCQVGIMPSKWEGFGLTAIEALILEKTVLNSGEGGLAEIFKEQPQWICGTVEEYVKAYENITEMECFNIIERYTNKEKWKEQLLQLYTN